MSRYSVLALLLTLTIVVSIPCFAKQPRASVKVWATDRACPALKPAVAEIGRVSFPEGWTVVIACNETQWETLQRKADAQGTARHLLT